MTGIESLLTGRTLADRYRIEEVIGRGGMGAVYRATDERLGRPVALKVITAATGADAEARARVRARFKHEASAAARLPHHPNVVPVYDYGTDAELGLDYIVMELLRGEDLATRLQRSGPPPLAVALRILRDAARGIAVGHRSGLIHRDVKPGNIFLVSGEGGDDFQVRVLDFGIAKAVAEEDTAAALTADGRAPLSPAYASPEQLRGEARLTPASDVFSLGAVGYQLLTGQRPYTEGDRARMAIGVDVPLPSLRARNPGVPDDVEAVVRRALADEPEERFQGAGLFADALEGPVRRLADTPEGEAVPPLAGTPEAAAAAAPPVPPAPPAGPARLPRTPVEDDRTLLAPVPPPPAAPAPVIPPPRRRAEPARDNTGRVILIVILLALLIGGGVYAFTQMNGGGPQAPPLSDLPDSAQVDTTQVDSLDAVDAAVMSLEGERAFRAGDYATAEQRFRTAVDAAPDVVKYRDYLGFTLLRLRRAQEAARVLEDAARVDPNYDLVYSHLAEARLALGDKDGAIQALRRFMDVSINRNDRERAQRLLDSLTAPEIVIPPAPQIDTMPVTDTIRPGPRDTIRMR